MTENVLNGMRYVGKCMRGVSRTVAYLGSGVYLNNAIRKHGREHFKKTILENGITDRAILCEREKHWVRQMDTRFPKGYNLTDGGDGGLALDPEIEKVRAAKIGDAHRGKVIPTETRERISNTLKGHTMLPQTREGMFKANFARQYSSEKRQQMIEDVLARKDIVQIDIETASVVGTFTSLREAVEKTKVKLVSINRCLSKKRKQAGYYIWMLKSDYEAIKDKLSPEFCRSYCERTPRVITEEFRAKCQSHCPHRKDIVKVDSKSNEIIGIYPTIAAAARGAGLTNATISRYVNGIRSQPSGVRWQLKKEYDAAQSQVAV